MESENVLHTVITGIIKQRLGREYREITLNPEGGPDLILGNHGLVLAAVEIETDLSLTPHKAEKWRAMLQPGRKLILMVPRNARAKAMEMLWEKGIADKVSLGTYEIVITMP